MHVTACKPDTNRCGVRHSLRYGSTWRTGSPTCLTIGHRCVCGVSAIRFVHLDSRRERHRKYSQLLLDCPTSLIAATAVSSKSDRRKAINLQNVSRTHIVNLFLITGQVENCYPRDCWGIREYKQKDRELPAPPWEEQADPAGRALPMIAFPALGCGSCCGQSVTGL